MIYLIVVATSADKQDHTLEVWICVEHRSGFDITKLYYSDHKRNMF